MPRIRAWGLLALPALGAILSVAAHWWPVLFWPAAVLVLVALLWALVGLARSVRAGELASFRVRLSRAAALTVAVGAWTYLRDPDGPLRELLGVLLLLGAAWWVRRAPLAVGRLLPYTAHLPGAPERPRIPRIPPGWTGVVLIAVLVLGYVIAAVALGSYAWLGLTVVGAAATVVFGRPWLGVLRAVEQTAAALSDLRPVFAMPYNGVAVFHIGMWLPYLQRADRPILVVTTDRRTFTRLARAYEVPIVCPADDSPAALAAVLPKTLRAAFYVHNKNNAGFLSFRKLTHVFLHHGDGDKPASSNPISRRYDKLVVAGQAAIDRYARRGVKVPADKFEILGRPQTETIATSARPIATVADPVVLYAPTWWGGAEDQNFSSLEVGEQIVAALLDRGATVIFRPHPAGRGHPPHKAAIAAIKELLAADRERTGREHVTGTQAEKEWSVADVANRADAMVSDVSGIVTDFMQTLKPFAMVTTRTDTAGFRAEYPTSQSAYVIEGQALARGDATTLDSALDQLLGSDPLATTRVERRRYYLGGFDDGGSADAFVAYVSTLAA